VRGWFEAWRDQLRSRLQLTAQPRNAAGLNWRTSATRGRKGLLGAVPLR
jgi:hypothetical protein